jgi:Ca2+-binding RTX toxin-like protein
VRDVIAGLGGDDTIRGNRGQDVICGGPGDDRLIGGGDGDRIYGANGDDRLIGLSGPGVYFFILNFAQGDRLRYVVRIHNGGTSIDTIRAPAGIVCTA